MIALLCYELVQRHADMRFVKRDDVKEFADGLKLTITQSKTDTDVHLDVEHLRSYIDAVKASHDSEWLCPKEGTNAPWRCRYAFAHKAREIADSAGLPKELRISDLRRSGALEMVEAGATHQELKDQGGWLSDIAVSHYTPRGSETAKSGTKKRLQNRRKAS
jgi:hypothetical protein